MNESTVLHQYDELAHKVAKRYYEMYKHTHEYGDIYQASCLGVLEAARSFDSTKSTSFKTHAYNCARYSIFHHLREDTGIVKTPYRADKTKNDAMIRVDLSQDLADVTEDESADIVDLENRFVLETAMQYLTENQRKVLEMIYFEEATMEDVAEKFQISRPTAYSWHNKAVEKLRNLMQARNIEIGDLLN